MSDQIINKIYSDFLDKFLEKEKINLQNYLDDVKNPPIHPSNPESTSQILSAGESPQKVHAQKLSEWAKIQVRAEPSNSETRFDGQLIVQVEDDPVVKRAVENLAGKHPEKTVVVQLHKTGEYRVVYGNCSLLSGQLRWQVVGHGRGGENERRHQTLGGHNAQALSDKLSALNEKLKASHDIDTTPNYISLVGCALADTNGEESKGYVQQLGEALNQKAGWRMEMGARQLPVSVNEEGRKISVLNGAERPVSDKSDKIVFSWTPQNEFVPKNSLTARLNRVLTVMDSLALGEQTMGSLDEQQQRDLADFFHHSDGQLDFRRFTLTMKTPQQYRVWANEALQLLQLSDAHVQLESLSGQEALEKSQAWNATHYRRLANWQNLGKTLQNKQVKITYRLSPQSLFIGDQSTNAFGLSRSLGLTWLKARASGSDATERFFKGIQTQAMLNEHQAIGPISERDTQQSRQFRQHLQNIMMANPTEHPDIFEPLALMKNFEVGDYMIKKGGQTLMISVRQEASSGKPTVYLYDPDVGETSIYDEHVKAIKRSHVSITSAGDRVSSKAYRMIALSNFHTSISTSQSHPILPRAPRKSRKTASRIGGVSKIIDGFSA